MVNGSKRSMGIIVFGVLSIIWGLYGLMFKLSRIADVFIFFYKNRAIEVFKNLYAMIFILLVTISVFLSLSFIISGIGVLRLKKWGFRLIIFLSLILLFWNSFVFFCLRDKAGFVGNTRSPETAFLFAIVTLSFFIDEYKRRDTKGQIKS
jgi:magnesium-transporting ATPase (P-type)